MNIKEVDRRIAVLERRWLEADRIERDASRALKAASSVDMDPIGARLAVDAAKRRKTEIIRQIEDIEDCSLS